MATGVVPYFSIQPNQVSTNSSVRCGKPGIDCSGMISMPRAPKRGDARMQSSSDSVRRKYSSWNEYRLTPRLMRCAGASRRRRSGRDAGAGVRVSASPVAGSKKYSDDGERANSARVPSRTAVVPGRRALSTEPLPSDAQLVHGGRVDVLGDLEGGVGDAPARRRSAGARASPAGRSRPAATSATRRGQRRVGGGGVAQALRAGARGRPETASAPASAGKPSSAPAGRASRWEPTTSSDPRTTVALTHVHRRRADELRDEQVGRARRRAPRACPAAAARPCAGPRCGRPWSWPRPGRG